MTLRRIGVVSATMYTTVPVLRSSVTGCIAIVVSGDTGPCAPLVEFARGADILVHEVINVDLVLASLVRAGVVTPEGVNYIRRHMEADHTTPEEIGKLAEKAGVGMVVLTHVVPGDEADSASAYTDGVSRFFNGRVVLANDLGSGLN